MIDRTIKKILDARDAGEFRTDSCIEDFARKHRLKFDDILLCLAAHNEQMKPCWYCEHLINRCYNDVHGTPCYNCSRRLVTQDNFYPSKKRLRTK